MKNSDRLSENSACDQALKKWLIQLHGEIGAEWYGQLEFNHVLKAWRAGYTAGKYSEEK